METSANSYPKVKELEELLLKDFDEKKKIREILDVTNVKRGLLIKRLIILGFLYENPLNGEYEAPTIEKVRSRIKTWDSDQIAGMLKLNELAKQEDFIAQWDKENGIISGWENSRNLPRETLVPYGLLKKCIELKYNFTEKGREIAFLLLLKCTQLRDLFITKNRKTEEKVILKTNNLLPLYDFSVQREKSLELQRFGLVDSTSNEMTILGKELYNFMKKYEIYLVDTNSFWLSSFIESSKKYLDIFKNKLKEKNELDKEGNWIIKLKPEKFYRKTAKHHPVSNNSQISEIITKNQSLAICDITGSGKTVFMHQILEEIIKQTNLKEKSLIPILIKLGNIGIIENKENKVLTYGKSKTYLPKSKKPIESDLEKVDEIAELLIKEFIITNCSKTNLKENLDSLSSAVDKFWHEKKFLLLLDGFDELDYYVSDIVLQWIDKLLEREYCIIITSRKIFLHKFVSLSEKHNLIVGELNRPSLNEAKNYINNVSKIFGKENVILNKQIKGLTPFQLFITSIIGSLGECSNHTEQFQMLVYGIVYWEISKTKPEISMTNDFGKMIKTLESDKIRIHNQDFNYRQLIEGSTIRIENQLEANLFTIVGKLAYLSFFGNSDNNIVKKLIDLNPLTKIFVEYTPINLKEVKIDFKISQLRDFFAANYIFAKKEKGELLNLLNRNIFTHYYNLLIDKYEKKEVIRILTEHIRTYGLPMDNNLETEKIEHKLKNMLEHKFKWKQDSYSALCKGIFLDLLKQDKMSKRHLVLSETLVNILLDNDYTEHNSNREKYQYYTKKVVDNEKYIEIIMKTYPQFVGKIPDHIQQTIDEINDEIVKSQCLACLEEEKPIYRLDLKEFNKEELQLKKEQNSKDYNKNIYLINLLEGEINNYLKIWASFSLGSYALTPYFRYVIDSYWFDQYLSMKLILISKNEGFIRYIIEYIWKPTLQGTLIESYDHHGDGWAPGPDPIVEYIEESLKAVICKDDVSDNLLVELFKWFMNETDDIPKMLELLFERMFNRISRRKFKQLIQDVFEYLPWKKYDDETHNMLIKYQKIWKDFIKEKNIAFLSWIKCETFEFSDSFMQNILNKLVERPMRYRSRIGKIFLSLDKMGIEFSCEQMIPFLGVHEDIDSLFRKKLPKDLKIEELLEIANKAPENLDLLVIGASQLNKDLLYRIIATMLEPNKIYLDNKNLKVLFDSENQDKFELLELSEIKEFFYKQIIRWLSKKSLDSFTWKKILGNQKLEIKKLSELLELAESINLDETSIYTRSRILFDKKPYDNIYIFDNIIPIEVFDIQIINNILQCSYDSDASFNKWLLSLLRTNKFDNFFENNGLFWILNGFRKDQDSNLIYELLRRKNVVHLSQNMFKKFDDVNLYKNFIVALKAFIRNIYTRDIVIKKQNEIVNILNLLVDSFINFSNPEINLESDVFVKSIIEIDKIFANCRIKHHLREFLFLKNSIYTIEFLLRECFPYFDHSFKESLLRVKKQISLLKEDTHQVTPYEIERNNRNHIVCNLLIDILENRITTEKYAKLLKTMKAINYMSFETSISSFSDTDIEELIKLIIYDSKQNHVLVLMLISFYQKSLTELFIDSKMLKSVIFRSEIDQTEINTLFKIDEKKTLWIENSIINGSLKLLTELNFVKGISLKELVSCNLFKYKPFRQIIYDNYKITKKSPLEILNALEEDSEYHEKISSILTLILEVFGKEYIFDIQNRIEKRNLLQDFTDQACKLLKENSTQLYDNYITAVSKILKEKGHNLENCPKLDFHKSIFSCDNYNAWK